MPFTLEQQKALAVAPKVSAILSMTGSLFIMKAILSDREKKINTYHRILFAMSMVDVLASSSYFASTWPIPKGSPGIWAPSGNIATCQLQGFFVQSSTCTPALNACLAVYYLLVGRYKWSEEKVQRWERLLIGGPIVTGYGTAIASIPLKLYNNANLWCWIAPFPLHCRDTYKYGPQASNCIRGDNAWIYRWAFAYAPVWLSIVVATLSMILVYCTVLTTEKAVDKFQEEGIAVRKQSVRIAWQGFWYIMAFYITWIPATVVRLLQTIPSTSGKDISFPLILSMAISLPMQGFFNFIVYSRSRYRKHRREHPADTRWEAIQVAVFSGTKKRRTSEEQAPVELEDFESLDSTEAPTATSSAQLSEGSKGNHIWRRMRELRPFARPGAKIEHECDDSIH